MSKENKKEISKIKIDLKNKKYFIGIDPGLTGAISFIEKIDYVGEISNRLLYVIDIPTFEVKVNGKARKKLDINKLFLIFKDFIEDKYLDDIYCVMEGVHARPTNGSLANYSMGYTIGSIETILNILNIDYSMPTPISWKKNMLLSSDKDASLNRAKELYVNATDYLKFKYHHDRAESILLASYGANFISEGKI